MTTVHVVRHAHAGDRSGWEGDDWERPLSPKGRRQAGEIARRLAGVPVSRVVSSSAARCVQTADPVAAAHGLAVATDPVLAEGADARHALALVRELGAAGTDAVLCSHGDVIPDLLVLLAAEGVELVDGVALRDGGLLRCSKASTWELTLDGDRVVRGCYVPPPGGH